ncbi:MAG: FAD-dependent oxidoreductase [Candidatus Obscuribacterales bacterium]|nr:FAD-dependent oxidoreductase [Candidatus Obscuribacterales bacterium]
MNDIDQVIIVGAGLAGLCCARKLHDHGIPFSIYEASDSAGGRVRTDLHDGFLLDRGFQIFLTAYPEARKFLRYDQLDFKPFSPGAMVRANGKFHELSDPFRCPMSALKTLFSSVGTISDKLLIVSLRQKAMDSSQQGKGAANAQSTISALKKFGFSESMINQFFRPFFAGIFLDPTLETSEKLFDFVFDMLARGDNVLPAHGMQSIPMQIADSLPADHIHYNQPVAQVEGSSIRLASGRKVHGRAIIVATEEPQCKRLLGMAEPKSFGSQTCVYYSTDKAPFNEPMIVLNGENSGIVTNLVVPSNVSPSYAPPGQSLIGAVVVGDAALNDQQLDDAVRNQMQGWFGSSVKRWNHLRTYRIKYALPAQTNAALVSVDGAYGAYRNGGQVYSCGDYKETGSINGAMLSGRHAAEAVITALGA